MPVADWTVAQKGQKCLQVSFKEKVLTRVTQKILLLYLALL